MGFYEKSLHECAESEQAKSRGHTIGGVRVILRDINCVAVSKEAYYRRGRGGYLLLHILVGGSFHVLVFLVVGAGLSP